METQRPRSDVQKPRNKEGTMVTCTSCPEVNGCRTAAWCRLENQEKARVCGTKREPLWLGLVSLSVAATSSQRAAYLRSNVAQVFWHGQANGRFVVGGPSLFSFLSLSHFSFNKLGPFTFPCSLISHLFI